MSKEKQIEIPEEEMGRSGYSKYSWKLHSTKKFTMAQAQLADQIMREEGYRKQSEGERITDEEGYVTCSVCGEEHAWEEFRPPYCDMCGAKMKGGAE